MSDAVFIPEQVRRQAARAEELRRELAGEPPEDLEPGISLASRESNKPSNPLP